jgi:hypothetical protein
MSNTNSKGMNLPDMDSLMNSIKTINRAVPALSNSAYSYFNDTLKMSSTIAEEIDTKVSDALVILPTSLEKMKSAESFAQSIAKINALEKEGSISADQADAAREQLEVRLNDSLSSTINSFSDHATRLTDSSDRLAVYANKITVRLKDANSTETANFDRAKKDADRENERVKILEARYEKLREAADEKRGGPLDEFTDIIPDGKELSSLLDVGAGDAAAPEAAAAKKAVELAVTEMKKMLESLKGVIKFMEIADLRDEAFKALQAQRKVANAASDLLKAENEKMGELDTVQSAGDAIGTVAKEVDKIASTFSSFVSSLKNLDGKEVDDDTISKLFDSMSSYLDQVRTDKNHVILT